MRVVVADPYGLGQSSSCRIDHADTGETSLSLELIPQLVRLEREIGPDIRSGKKPFANARPSREAGRELWQAYFSDAKALVGREYTLQAAAEPTPARAAQRSDVEPTRSAFETED
jgi:hypothetical protein